MPRKSATPAYAPAAADTSDATRAAVLEVVQQPPASNEPLTVSPAAAPDGTLDPTLVPLVAELRSIVAPDAETSAEAAAHLDDFTLARFIIARDRKMADAVSMFRETMRWREARGVNALRRELHAMASHADGSPSATRHAASRAHFFAGWGGCCKDGSPFFVEKMGTFDVAGANRDPAVYELMMDSYVTYLETAFSACRLASARSGAMQRAHSIVDASDVSLAHASNVRVIKAVAKIGTSYYPEIMRKVTIVNVPWAFAAVWNLVAPLLPEQTRKKIAIYGKNYLPSLLEEIDAAELPAQFGGAREEKNAVPRAEKVPPGLGEQLAAAAAAAPAVVDAVAVS